jgi:hypothetical protein
MARKANANGNWLRASLVVGTATLASLIAAGCGSSPPPPPTAYVIASLMQGDGTCMASTDNMTWFSIFGGTDSSMVTGVPNGDQFAGSAASVSCTVAPSGSKFTVSARVQTGGGSFTLSATMTDSGTQDGLSTSFTNSAGVTYSEAMSDCTFTFNPPNTTSDPSIKAGAVWGTMNCPSMTDGQPDNTCEGNVTFQLTNCTQ